ncbi:Uncharacterized protein FWK35_00035338 [Aphis craccivora]|uniref:Uncharacterized protein n=1 Tax=Aphis craccivora TaxID=307492 RepID=A0A6G0VJX8_APHCR|nr:Uncharacterized protein FWK35_00035338 [Aphis craccivora]
MYVSVLWLLCPNDITKEAGPSYNTSYSVILQSDFSFLQITSPLYWSSPYESDNLSLEPVGNINMFSLLFASAIPSDKWILYLACTMTLFHVPLTLVKVVPSQLPYLSNVPPLVCEVMKVSFIFKPDIIPPNLV